MLNHPKFRIAVKTELIRRGWTYKDLAQRIEYSPKTIDAFMSNSEKINAQRDPSMNVANKIAEKLGINIEEYMTKED